MADKKPLYSTCVAILGFVCFAVGATAIGVPMWGYFDTPNVGQVQKRDTLDLGELVSNCSIIGKDAEKMIHDLECQL